MRYADWVTTMSATTTAPFVLSTHVIVAVVVAVDVVVVAVDVVVVDALLSMRCCRCVVVDALLSMRCCRCVVAVDAAVVVAVVVAIVVAVFAGVVVAVVVGDTYRDWLIVVAVVARRLFWFVLWPLSPPVKPQAGVEKHGRSCRLLRLG
jgi:hypothetical protein